MNSGEAAAAASASSKDVAASTTTSAFDQEQRIQDNLALKAKFDEADTSGRGLLDVNQIRTLLECTEAFCYSVHVITKDETFAILDQYDRDGDQKLDWDEFVQFASDKLILEDCLREMSAAFTKLDADGDGRLARADLRRLFDGLHAMPGSRGRRVTDAALDELVLRYGDTTDSKHGLSFDEFVVMGRTSGFLPDLADVVTYVSDCVRPSVRPSVIPHQRA